MVIKVKFQKVCRDMSFGSVKGLLSKATKAEVSPLLDVTPEVNLSLNSAIGLRYYFH